MTIENTLREFVRRIGAGIAALGGYAHEHPLRLAGICALVVGLAASWRVDPLLGTVVSVVLGAFTDLRAGS